MSAATDSSGPLVYQCFIAKALRMSWAEARAFVEAQGFATFPRGTSTRTWAMASRDWDAIATRIGATTPALAAASMKRAGELADRALGHRARPASRRRSSGSKSRSA